MTLEYELDARAAEELLRATLRDDAHAHRHPLRAAPRRRRRPRRRRQSTKEAATAARRRRIEEALDGEGRCRGDGIGVVGVDL